MIWLLAIQLAIGPTEHYEHAKQDLAQQKLSEAASEVNAALHENPYMVSALVLKARLATLAHRPDVAKAVSLRPLRSIQHPKRRSSISGCFSTSKMILSRRSHRFRQPKNSLPIAPARVLSRNDPRSSGKSEQCVGALPAGREPFSADSPQTAEIAVAYGRLLVSLGRTQDGIEKERRAIEIDPKSRDGHYVLAKGLEHEGDFENAALEGELALTLPEANASDAEIHFLLTRLYRKLNKPDLAEAHMEKFLALKKTTQK